MDRIERKIERFGKVYSSYLYNPERFLGYCEEHSKTPRALFHINDVSRLCHLAGYAPVDFDDFLTPSWMSITYLKSSSEDISMKDILEDIKQRKAA